MTVSWRWTPVTVSGRADEGDVPVVLFAEESENAAELVLPGDPRHPQRNEDLLSHAVKYITSCRINDLILPKN